MNKTRSVLLVGVLALAGHATAELLVGFETWINPTTTSTNNASATGANSWGQMYYRGTWVQSPLGEGSTDGGFGSMAGASAVNDSKFQGSVNTIINDSYLEVKVKNTHATMDLSLESFNFDGFRTWAKAPKDWTLEVLLGSVTTGLVGSGTLTQMSVSAPSAGTPANDFEDVDVDLTGLADHILAAGEQVVFKLNFSGSTGVTAVYIDNVAVYGSVIPEPATLGLVALVSAALLMVRRTFSL